MSNPASGVEGGGSEPMPPFSGPKARIKHDVNLAPAMDRSVKILVRGIKQVNPFGRNHGTRQPQGDRARFLDPALPEATGRGVFGTGLGRHPPARRKPMV